MGLNKCKGNMYPWITHTHTHLGGRCPHECVYCSIQDMQKRFPKQLPYSGALRLKEKEFAVNYGTGKTIFVENCNDIGAIQVPFRYQERIFNHCCEYPENTYVFQSKNPRVFLAHFGSLPPKSLIGTTIETNRETNLGKAPYRSYRFNTITRAKAVGAKTFITIEPIMDFDVKEFAREIIKAKPDFVNIGADSKSHGLPEPSMEKVLELVKRLTDAGIEVREKRNLDRLRSE